MNACFARARWRSLALRGWLARSRAGAVLALVGFCSQYPIPVIHRCPVLNPQIDAATASTASQADSRDAGPICHRHSDLGQRPGQAEAESTDEGPHGHDSCPVCQGHAQLLPALLSGVRPLPDVLYKSADSFLALIKISGGRSAVVLPGSRAPPRFS